MCLSGIIHSQALPYSVTGTWREKSFSRAPSAEGRSRGWHVQYDNFAEGDSFLSDPVNLHRFNEQTFLSEVRNHKQKARCKLCSLPQPTYAHTCTQGMHS